MVPDPSIEVSDYSQNKRKKKKKPCALYEVKSLAWRRTFYRSADVAPSYCPDLISDIA